MGIFNENSANQQSFTKGIQGAAGIGFNLDSNGNYDMINKKLTNVGSPTSNADAATNKYVDDNISYSSSSSSHTIDSNIDLKDTYNVTNSKKRNWNQLKAADDLLVSYEEVKEIFLSLNEKSIMKDNTDMDNHRVLNLANTKRSKWTSCKTIRWFSLSF